MPIYEYQCSGCHHTFDLIQKMSDEPIKLCPSCSKETAVRLVSAAGFQLKGTGWYATDFKTKSQPEKSTSTRRNLKRPKPLHHRTRVLLRKKAQNRPPYQLPRMHKS